MQPYKLTGPDAEILRTVRNAPGIPVARLADKLFPAYAPGWTRERARRLAQVGLIRIEQEKYLVVYPAGGEPAT